jgi:hypothetical protein
MSELLQDVRLAFRRLRQSPGFTLFAVASLALGIGVTTAIYSAVRTLLWMPLGVPHEDTLLQIRSGRPIEACPGPTLTPSDAIKRVSARSVR